jgi:hypothetical protein
LAYADILIGKFNCFPQPVSLRPQVVLTRPALQFQGLVLLMQKYLHPLQGQHNRKNTEQRTSNGWWNKGTYSQLEARKGPTRRQTVGEPKFLAAD